MKKLKNRSKKKSLEVLVTEAWEHLKSLDYGNSTLAMHRANWRAFIRYSQDTGATKGFTIDLVEQFLNSRNILASGCSKSASSTYRHLQASMRILTELSQHGYFERRRQGAQKMLLSRTWKELFGKYREFRQGQRRTAIKTLPLRMYELQRFLYFLERQGIHSPNDISKTTFSSFLKMLAHVKPRTLSTNVSVVRSFLQYLSTQGLVNDEIIEQIPNIRAYSGQSIPAIWTAKDLKAILNAVDRDSPLGKRDYAILLLAARLGLRVGDIRTLRLEQLDWDHARIHVTQAKTGVPLELPLLEDVGQALIDYLKHGRPVTSCREVFLRHLAPFEPFSHGYNMHTIISKYRRKAGIKLPDKNRCGLHSLRHTLASRLLEADTPVDVIAGVLGHASPETTRLYLKVDIRTLRSVALDPEEVFHETE